MRVRLISSDDIDRLLAFEKDNRSWFEKHIEARPADFYSRHGVASHIDQLVEAANTGNTYPGIHARVAGRLLNCLEYTRSVAGES